MKVFKSLETSNIWKQVFIPLTIFVHKFYCWCGWTRLYHNLRLGSNVCTLLYYCQSDKTGLNNTGQTGGTPDADIDAPEAWNIQKGNNVLIGVIDTALDYTHPDLAANIWTNPGEIAGDG